ncbi:ATP-dependent DNA ligase [Terrisporobacter mayombei]|nr:ATP-dependent DNA ligase [Terrisporobacter mayombei]
MNEIYEAKEIFDKISSVSGRLAKEKILRDNKDNELFIDCLKFLIDPHIKTGISTSKLNKELRNAQIGILSLRELMEYFYKGNITGRDADIKQVQYFINNQDKELHEFLKLFVTKKLRLGLNEKVINKIIPGLIATSDDEEDIKPMLASKFDFDKPPKEKMFVSEKLDGIRCNAIIRDGKVKLYTRQGKIIEGLEEIEQELSKVFANAFVDGELLAEGCSYEDVYKETTKRVKNKNKIKTGVKYVMFDTLSLEEFDNKKCKTNYDNRRLQLDNYIDHIKINNCEHIEVLPILYEGKDIEKVLSLLDEYRKLGAEGLMCNLNKPYEFKRSKTILKLKVMQSCDLKITGFESGDGKYSNTLGKIICDYKGYELGVGSGFTDAMRDEIYNNQDKYLNRIAEINYFEETHNEDGGLSLRFPIFKCVREEGKEVSYE